MVPIILIGLFAAIISNLRPQTKTSVIGADDDAGPRRLPPYQNASEPAGMVGPPLKPEEERLLALLVLWAKDKKNPLGRKRYMTPSLASEIVRLCVRLGLPGTGRAILKDGPIPEGETLRGRGISVRRAIVAYGTGKFSKPAVAVSGRMGGQRLQAIPVSRVRSMLAPRRLPVMRSAERDLRNLEE
jgi:hypothetical protein